jgi:phospholipid/cholesterol/gamma-HCH transport system substrate-binding protein
MKSRVFVRVGILFIATLVILFWGLNYLKGKNIFSSDRSFYALYQKVGGLTRSSPVTVNGFQVGQVRKIELSSNQTDLIEVKFSVSYPSIKIPKGSTARIYSVDLMGTKGISLELSKDVEGLSPNDTLSGTIEGDLRDQVNAQMLPLKIKAETLMSSMDSVLYAIQLVFDQSNRENLAESFSSINQTLNNLESASRFLNDYVRNESTKISAILRKADSLGQGLLDEKGELQTFIENLRQFSDSLAVVPINETFASFRLALEHIQLLTNKIADGGGSLGKLIISDSIYNAVLATNSSLNRLIEDIRIHPGRYVRVSLLDKSRSVYSANDSELVRILSSDGPSEYYVCLMQTDAPLSPDNPLLKDFSAEQFIQVGGIYYYFTYHNKRIEPCIRKLDKIRVKHPEAGIFTWVDGRWTRLSI